MYSRKYNGHTITVRKPTAKEISNGEYSERSWIYNAENNRISIEGIAYEKKSAIKFAKEATRI